MRGLNLQKSYPTNQPQSNVEKWEERRYATVDEVVEAFDQQEAHHVGVGRHKIR